jgi:2-iminobutanoate/2-iminopropanoate deaminase
MRIIKSDKIPEPKGHYSPAIEHHGVLYLSGQLPVDPVSGKVPGNIEDQTQQALENVRLILTEAGSAMDRVLTMRLYISDIALWTAVNQVYAAFLGAHKPARAIIPTRDLHHGCLIEIEAMAVCE